MLCALSTAPTSNTSAATLKATKAIGACCVFLKALDHLSLLLIIPMTDLSPAAQAVLDAYFTHADLLNREVSHEEMISAAIRALADEVIPITKTPWGSTFVPVFSAMASRERILAIATELEGK